MGEIDRLILEQVKAASLADHFMEHRRLFGGFASRKESRREGGPFHGQLMCCGPLLEAVLEEAKAVLDSLTHA